MAGLPGLKLDFATLGPVEEEEEVGALVAFATVGPVEAPVEVPVDDETTLGLVAASIEEARFGAVEELVEGPVVAPALLAPIGTELAL